MQKSKQGSIIKANNLKKSLRDTFAPAFIACAAALLTVSAAYADTQRERCQNVAQTAQLFAKERDKGVTSKEIGRRITSVFNAGALTESEYMAMYGLAGMVYSDYKNISPEKLRQMYLSYCN